ncbi:hypothetical protein [uncultured Bacteroides sp.]|uniref:hypothetical protein n=1 Tax=uncultured Bacteroides sp. TaxID=162156 RepID=UPI00272C186C|nr:hypothetical protein [uncultured Bacteroides sp.]
MIKIEKVSIHGLEETIRGMRNPMNSWDKSDSGTCKGGDDGIGCKNCAKEASCEHTYDHSFQLGKADHELMMKLAAGGPVHAKYRRMITVYLDITAPLYWWKEFDTYKVGTVANSCSTMHKIQAKEFTRTVMLNYEVLASIYRWRKDHKLDEWREFCRWIEQLPYSEFITCNAKGGVKPK